jgi:hypothetical protein
MQVTAAPTVSDRFVGSAVAAALSHRSRKAFWGHLVNQLATRTVAEAGVWKGDLAIHLLDHCPSIERYYMIDPWRHLENWNKPANISDSEFAPVFREAMEKTDRHRDRRVVVREKTVDAVQEIPDGSLDLCSG